MATFLVRVALSDRPGALGAVASRIGAVRGDVVCVEILERSDGRALDEFVVDLADQSLLDLLISEIEEVDGVAVEAVRQLGHGGRLHRQEAYDGAVAVLSEHTPQGVLTVVAALARKELDAIWSAVVDTSGGDGGVLCADGRVPAARWLVAHAQERTATPVSQAPDILCAEMASWDLLLMVGRPGWPFVGAEQGRLEALARLADARWAGLARPGTSHAHPSGWADPASEADRLRPIGSARSIQAELSGGRRGTGSEP